MEKKEYKTFKDLEFKPWCHRLGIIIPGFAGGIQAMLEFPNGYGVSVLNGEQFYCDENTYEVAVIKGDKVVYPEGICPDGDVLGWRTTKQVTEIMKKVQEL